MRPQVIVFLVFVAVVALSALAISGVFMTTGPTDNQAPSRTGAP